MEPNTPQSSPDKQSPTIQPTPENSPATNAESPVATPAPGQIVSPAEDRGPRKTRLTKTIVIVIITLVLIAGAVAALLIFKSTKSSKNDDTKQVSDSQKKSTGKPQRDYSRCLTKTELASFDNDEYALKDVDGVYYQYESFFFLPNSTSYEYADQVEQDYARIKAFAAPLQDKQWLVSLKGQIKDVGGTGNSADNKKLANDRAAKVQADLIAKSGIQASRISIEEPEIYDVNEITPGDSDRNVSFTLSTQCADKQIEKITD